MAHRAPLKNVERIEILISCGDKEQFIIVPRSENSIGKTQAKAVFFVV